DTGTPVPTLHLQRPDGTTLTANNTHIEKLTNDQSRSEAERSH
ncbi:hypothetical protein SAMN04487819_1381, partial [Actinopolyspora alba]